jgi:hypothetical protein
MTPYYSDDLVTIYHGDCREWMPEADVVVTDPPYGIGWDRGPNVGRGSKPQPGIVGDADTASRDAIIAGWLPKPAVVFGSDLATKPAGLRHTLYWHKPPDSGVYGSTTGYRRDVELIFLCGTWPRLTTRWSSVLRSQVGGSGQLAARTGHPHTKPVDLLIELIGRCPPGTILDPFAGSGSTLVAAKSLGRKSIGIEIEERYCEIAATRCSQEVLGLVG